jgi:DDE superfamily endonuclease
MPLVSSFVVLVQQMGASMTAPTLASLVTMVTGWLYAGRRTITGIIVAAGAVGQKHHSAYHRVFAAAAWSLDGVGLALFGLIRPLLAPGVVALSLDDTLARKRGRKVYGAGMHHDPLISSRRMKVMNWGHAWVVLAVRVSVPLCPGRVFSLPVLFRLYLNRKAAARWRRAYRTRTELAAQLLSTLCQAHPDLHFHVYADSTYGCQQVLKALPANCDMTARLHMKAALCAPLAPQAMGKNGRPRLHGLRLPSPQQMLKQKGRRLTLHLYGRRDRVRLMETTACWYNVPGRLLKIVVVEPLTGGRRPQAFFSTVASASAQQVLTGYSGRWSIEEAFLGAKQHLGFEQPQGWSRLAVLRTAPMAMLLYSLVVVWFAREGQAHFLPAWRPWNRHKVRPSFADMLATVKQASLQEGFSQASLSPRAHENLLSALLITAQASA